MGHLGADVRVTTKMATKKIKVLAVADYLGRSNVNPFRPEAAQLIGLQNSGEVEVTVLCSPESVLTEYYGQHGIATIGHKISAKISLPTIRLMRRLIRERGFDIMHLFHSRAISNGVIAAIGSPVKVVVYRGQPGSLRRYDPISYLNCLNPRIDKIICVSHAVEKYLQAQLWGSSDKLVTIYKGHDLSDLDLPDKAFKVVMVANLRAHKGLHVLIDATRYLPVDAPIFFLLVGPRPDDPKVAQMVGRAANPERFRILGYRNDAPEVAAAADVIVLPTTKREGLARAVVEAMAGGTPAVVSDSGGNAELVADGQSGYVVPAEDAAALADGIRRLWSEPETCRTFGAEARKRIATVFNVEQGVQKTLQVYRDLCDHRG